MLPAHWALESPSWLMTGPATLVDPALPDAYRATTEILDGVIQARISAPDNTLAASGYAAEAAGVFVYDRIVTVPAQQRRGLGRAVMALLGAHRRSATSRPVLVATAEGRALYATLGWEVHAPYASAVIPDAAA